MAEDKKHIYKTALLYLQEGKWDRAITEFKRLAAMDPEDLNNHNILGDAYLKKGSLKEAYEEYMIAADGYTKRNETEKATSIYKKVAKLDIASLDPSQKERLRHITLRVKGDTDLEAGSYESAAAAFQEVVNITPDDIEVVFKLAECYARLGKGKEASEYYLKVAKFFLDQRVFRKALGSYQKAAEMDPMNLEARQALGDLLAREGQELEARKEFEAVAEIYIAQDQLDRAQAACQRAIQLKSIDAHHLLGDIHLRKGLYEEARGELEKFLKIKAAVLPAQYKLGVCLVQKGALDDALAVFGKILGRQADHVEALERMAEVYQKKGATRDAVAQYLGLAQVFTAQKIMNRAEEAIRKALEIDGANVDAHKRLAELFEARGMRKEAAQSYRAALDAARTQGLPAEVKACEEKIRAIDPSLLDGPAEALAAAAPPPAVPAVPIPLPPAVAAVPAPPPPAPPVAAPPSPLSPEATPRSGLAAVPPPPPPRLGVPPPVAPAPRPFSGPALPASLALPRENSVEGPAPRAAIPAPPPPPGPAVRILAPPAPRPAVPLPAPPPVPRPGAGPALSPVEGPATPPVLEPVALSSAARPRVQVPPKQRAQRLINLAHSAAKQSLPDEANDYLQQALELVGDDPEQRSAIQALIFEFAGVKAGVRAAPAPAAAEAAPAAKSPEDIEREIRERRDQEYRQRLDRERQGAAAGVPAGMPDALAATRDQILRHAAPADPAEALTSEAAGPYGRPVPAPEEAAPALAGAGAPSEPAVKARRRVSYV